MLWGAIESLPKPMRLPTTKAPTNAAIPALMCTTVPPAKSLAPWPPNKVPASLNKPPPQTIWAIGI